MSLGLMMLVGHGWGKLSNFGPTVSLFQEKMGISPLFGSLAIIAESLCAVGLIVGVKTRWMALMLAVTMGVAAFMIKADDPWFLAPGVTSAKEPALLYLVGFLALFLTGPGKISIDQKIMGMGQGGGGG